MTIGDIKKLEAGDGCKKKIARVESRWFFGQFAIGMKKRSKDWIKEDVGKEGKGDAKYQKEENAANERKHWDGPEGGNWQPNEWQSGQTGWQKDQKIGPKMEKKEAGKRVEECGKTGRKGRKKTTQ